MKYIERFYGWLTGRYSDNVLHFYVCLLITIIFGCDYAIVAALARESVHLGNWHDDCYKDLAFDFFGMSVGGIINIIINIIIQCA